MNKEKLTEYELKKLAEFEYTLDTNMWKIEYENCKKETFIAFGTKDDFDDTCVVYHKWNENHWKYFNRSIHNWSLFDKEKTIDELISLFNEFIKNYNESEPENY